MFHYILRQKEVSPKQLIILCQYETLTTIWALVPVDVCVLTNPNRTLFVIDETKLSFLGEWIKSCTTICSIINPAKIIIISVLLRAQLKLRMKLNRLLNWQVLFVIFNIFFRKVYSFNECIHCEIYLTEESVDFECWLASFGSGARAAVDFHGEGDAVSFVVVDVPHTDKIWMVVEKVFDCLWINEYSVMHLRLRVRQTAIWLECLVNLRKILYLC